MASTDGHQFLLFAAAGGGADGGPWHGDAAERWPPLVVEDVLRSWDAGGCNYGIGGTVNGRSPSLTILPPATAMGGTAGRRHAAHRLDGTNAVCARQEGQGRHNTG